MPDNLLGSPQNHPRPVENELQRYFAAAQPSPAFAALLEKQLVDQARRLPDSPPRPNRGPGLLAALRWTAGLAALAGLVLLMVFAMRLIPRQGGTPLSPTPSPSATAEQLMTSPYPTIPGLLPARETAAVQPNNQQTIRRLLPGLCPPATPDPSQLPQPSSRPQGFLGGGELTSNGFTFELRLACDPSFRAGAPDYSRYSEIEGLGIYQSWRYSGPTLTGETSIYAGFDPFVTLTHTSAPELADGSYSQEQGGVQFPAEVFPDFGPGEISLRYILKLQTPGGEWQGAVLRFRLQPLAEGYRPVDAAIEPFVPGDLASQPPVPFATREPASVEPLLGEIAALNARWQANLLSGAGWLHIVSRVEDFQLDRTPANGSPIPAVTIDDSWYQLDEQGRTIAWITRVLDEAGEPSQISIMKDGVWTNLTLGESGKNPGPPSQPELDFSFYREAAWGVKMGAPLRKEAESFRAPGQALASLRYMIDYTSAAAEGTNSPRAGMRIEVVYNPETGQAVVIRDYRSPGPGQEIQLERQITTLTTERLAAPPTEILALLDQKAGPYQPMPPVGEPTPPGFDPSKSPLSLKIVAGDSASQPTFFYGDVYALYQPGASGGVINPGPGEAAGYLLGRVDFGATPGGECDRSADGSRIAYLYRNISNPTAGQVSSLRWLDLHDVKQVFEVAPNTQGLQPTSPPAWAPRGSRLAFTACDGAQNCGLYIADPPNTPYLLAYDLTSPRAPLWKPDGSQIAVQTLDRQSGTLHLNILDAASGKVIYQGPLAGSPAGSPTVSPFESWSVTFPSETAIFAGCSLPGQ